ncbi:MAG: transcriptional regulator, partial [Gammaproteobacteria bacterium]
MQLNDLQNGFKLGNYLIEPLRGLITGAHKQKHLQPKSMDVLVFLASHANQVVSRQQLLDAVWGPRYVSDEPLTRCIADLRAAFSDNPKQPKFIETIPKRGYHLIAEVQLSGDENETVRSQVLKRKQRFSNVLFATIVIIAVGSIYLLQ